MAKGKKFDAAEKHFIKKEESYRRDIRQLHSVIDALRVENAKLTAENERLSTLNAVIIETQNLSENDIRLLLEKAANEKKLVGLLNLLE